MAPNAQMFGTAAGASVLLHQYVAAYPLGAISSTVLLFLLQFFVYQAWSIIVYPRYFSPLRHIPTPPGSGLIMGQTSKISRESAGMPMREWIETMPNDGLIRYSFYFNERILVTNPKALTEVLVTKNYDFVKPWQFRTGLARILGVGILLAEGDEHKTQRKNLMPAFAYRHIKELYPVFWDKSRELVQALSKASDVNQLPKEETTPAKSDDGLMHAPGIIEVGNWCSRAALDIIGVSGMGQDFNALKDPNAKLNQVYRNIFNPGRVGRLLQLAGIFIPFWILKRLPLKRNHEVNGASLYIKDVCRDLIEKKRKVMSEKERTEPDIISVALESGGFTDEDLVNQMMTFLVAGHETTASSMNWAIYMLCKHPEIQKKLREEVRSKLPSIDADVTAAEVDDCHYLHAFCTEVLRLHPAVMVTQRVADKDTSICGHFIPKGTAIILAPGGINASTHLWGRDALEFKPERWLDADGKANNKGGADSNFSFLTFLHGPRSCIGQKFAQAEFACLVAAWVGRFETTFEEGSPLSRGELEIKGGVTAKPKGGVWVQLKELDGW